MRNKRIFVLILSLAIICWSIGAIIFDPRTYFFTPYYTTEHYKNLEKLFNASQYRLKEPSSIIADEVVFRYAAGAYIRGVDPILINSEHTPLGKYIIGISLLIFKTDGPVILLASLLSIFTLWLISTRVLKDRVMALVPVVFFATEELFLNQLRVTPLLDIIQLPFILLAIYSFICEYDKKNYLWTSIVLGLVAATKSVVPTILLICTFYIFFAIKKRNIEIFRFTLWLLMSLCILILSYTKTFLNGYTFWDFLGFQKWIFLYQQSKLIFPLSFWKLTLLNQWQTWWGEMKIMPVDDWRWTWPILVLLPIALIFQSWRKKLPDTALVLILWCIIYEIFLSLGVIATRFMLPLLPILYILAIYTLYSLFKHKSHV